MSQTNEVDTLEQEELQNTDTELGGNNNNNDTQGVIKSFDF